MHGITVSAVLTESTGSILLVRRKESALWRLPGGAVSRDASILRLLVSLCRRQVGVTPEFMAPLLELELLGRRVLVGQDQIRAEQARACGWIESVQWCRRENLPLGVDPLTAMVLSLTSESTRAHPVVHSASSTTSVVIGR